MLATWDFETQNFFVFFVISFCFPPHMKKPQKNFHNKIFFSSFVGRYFSFPGEVELNFHKTESLEAMKVEFVYV